MNTEQQRQQAEVGRERAEDDRQQTENQRNIDENRRQRAEKRREAGEQLREIERTGEQLVGEYSTRAIVARIVGIEEPLNQVEVLLNEMHTQLQQLVNSAI